MTEEAYPVRVTEIGEYIRHNLCERRFKLEFRNREIANQLPFAARFYNPIDPVLQATGEDRENQLAHELVLAGFSFITQQHYNPNNRPAQHPTWDNFLEEATSLRLGQNAFAREVVVEATTGAFHITGRIDFLMLIWRNGQPVLRVVEVKASRRDKTYHRIQVALYRMLIRRLIELRSLNIHEHRVTGDEIECSIVRIDEEQNRMQSILNTLPLGDLSQEETDINRLLSQEGPLVGIITTPLNELDYKLDLKCDDCVFDVDCFPESSLHRRLELLSIEPSDIRSLRENEVHTIDDLADIDLTSPQARRIESNPSFTQNLHILKTKARARRSTLPRGGTDPDGYQVEQLPYQGYGQLPYHAINNEPLIRIYLAVDYDYVEDRIVGLSAHVTSSANEVETRAFPDGNGRWSFDPVVYEADRAGNRVPLVDRPIIHFITSRWSGDYHFDSGIEGGLIQSFFSELVDRIAEVANGRASAPIHFYVWSREEITHLIEACTRVDTRLLSHLNELFGCRESLDQLIFSCLRDEINQRYALGWTGRGLSVATSLSWFGRRYHWTRRVLGRDVWLEREFNQDIFDFKTRLSYFDDQTWADPDSTDSNIHTHVFELRSRFNDGLTVPYWHAVWRTLPNPASVRDPRTGNAIERYNTARNPGVVRAFQIARVHALRWLEERISPKNRDIEKPALIIAGLPSFSLNVGNTAQAALDFLRLDNHVKRTDWIAQHLVPPANRINSGETILVTGMRWNAPNNVTVRINLAGYNSDIDTIRVSSVFSEGSYVRLTPCDQDSNIGQRLFQLINDGMTCRIRRIDWQSGEIELSSIPAAQESRYILPSYTWNNRVFEFATIDSSLTDFVAKRVDEHLNDVPQSPVYDWFHPEHPAIPIQAQLINGEIGVYQRILENFVLQGGHHLVSSQIESIIAGLATRIQLLQGPPGTGKTITTAIAILLRILARIRIGNIVLISASTHTALDNILARVQEFSQQFRQRCEEQGRHMPNVVIAKVHSSDPEDIDAVDIDAIHNFRATVSRSNVRTLTAQGVVLIGGTTAALLKMHDQLVRGAQFRNGFGASSLIIDEASMLVFPHFLALSTLVSPQGEIMLAGDYRQLAPIVSHDWENEDRPPVIVYQPYKSAYEAIRDIARRNVPAEAVRSSQLSFTFRLPPPLVELISRLYRLDDIALQGLPRDTEIIDALQRGSSWNRIWDGSYGLFLVLHSERRSQKYNQFEAEIVRYIVEAGLPQSNNAIAVVTPHRAQRSLLKTLLAQYYGGPVGIIDTVERLQGDERSIVILSATESDVSYINSNVGFILDLNRSNVAFSRSRDRLVVVCSETLMNHIPPDYEQYESTMLWKALRNVCSRLVAHIDVQGERVRVFTFEPPQRTCAR
jgi:hypothetical protein